MGIVQDIERLKEQQAAKAAEPGENDQPQEDQPLPEAPAVPADPVNDEPQKEPEGDSPAVNPEDEDKFVHSKLRKLERENRALQQRIEEAVAVKAPELVKHEAKKEEPAEPNREEDLEGWLIWKNSKLEKQLGEISQWKEQTETQNRQAETYQRAIQNFGRIESEFRSSFKDPKEYDGATSHMIEKMKEGVRYVYPTATDAQIGQFVHQQLLNMADSFASRRLNPAEELYNLAIDKYGYAHVAEAPPAPDQKKATVKTVADNRKKSVTSLHGGSSDRKTLPSLKSLTPGQIGALSPEQLAEIKAASRAK